jgi:hypothetical protein
MDSTTMIFFPLLFFFIEGILFFSTIPLSNVASVLNIMQKFPKFVPPSGGNWLTLLIASNPVGYAALWFASCIIYVVLLIAWVLTSIVLLFSIMWTTLTISFQMSTYYPVLLVINIPLVILMGAGIALKIKIMGSGAE